MTAAEAKITADKARELASSITETKAAKQLILVENKIVAAAKLGSYSVALGSNFGLMAQVTAELEKRGFTVKQDYDRDGDSWTTVSWTK